MPTVITMKHLGGRRSTMYSMWYDYYYKEVLIECRSGDMKRKDCLPPQWEVMFCG